MGDGGTALLSIIYVALNTWRYSFKKSSNYVTEKKLSLIGNDFRKNYLFTFDYAVSNSVDWTHAKTIHETI